MKHDIPAMHIMIVVTIIVTAFLGAERMGHIETRLDALEARPSVSAPILLPAALTAPSDMTPPHPRVQSYAEWRASEPRTIATEEEIEGALVEAGMPQEDARTLSRLAVNCEAPVIDRVGVSIGADLSAVGDQGRAIGAFQIRLDAHPWARELDLTDLDVSAQAAVHIWREAGSLAPWACS